MNCVISDIFPLKVGTKWIYRVESGLFGRDVRLEVMDRKNSHYLIKCSLNNMEVSVVLNSDVDLSVVSYSKRGVNSLNSSGQFEAMQKTEILKSPVITGNAWTNNFGTFSIVDTNHTLKFGKRMISGCVHLDFRDSSNAHNDIYIKEGIGVIFASIYIDNIGKVNINLKAYN